MPARSGRSDPGTYPERDKRPGSLLERMVGRVAFWTQAAFARQLRSPALLAEMVHTHASRYRGLALLAVVPELRYQLRRDGLAGDPLAECFGLYAAALPPAQAPGPQAITGAAALVRGGIVDLADAHERRQALEMAATAFALCGVPVHLYASSDAGARQAAAALAGPLAALGLSVATVSAERSNAERRVAYGAAVACGTQRVMAFDYLRDRVQLGRRLRPLQSRLERLSGDTTAGAVLPLMHGLHCALVADADEVLLDDARTPMVMSADVAHSPDRLVYEQALELARALEPGSDFALAAEGVRIAARGAERLAHLGVLLGGVWAARQQREALVATALVAQHTMQKGRDYQVAQGRVQLPQSEAPPDESAEQLQRLLEVKEDLPFAGRRDVLARLSVPQFYQRYLRLAGACADARGLEGELWALYGLHCRRAGAPATPPDCQARIFETREQRRSALGVSVREHAARGHAVVVAVRGAGEGEALVGMLQQSGVRIQPLQGATGSGDGEASAHAARPGSVTISMFPAHRGVVPGGRGGVPLHLVVAELHEARRTVSHIARAVAADTCEQYLALEDEVVREALGTLASGMAPIAGGSGELGAVEAARLAALAQAAAERAAARARREMLEREQSLGEALAFSGRPE